MSALGAAVEAVSLLGPGLTDWEAARPVLAGRVAYTAAPTQVPAPTLLPANERRRSGLAVRLALAVGGRPSAPVVTVFASSSADGDTCHAICEQLAGDDRLISPTRFHNSVHNAPAGYWSIATRDMSTSTSVCAFDGSFAAGLLEACALVRERAAPVRLIAYDAPYPEPLRAARLVPDAFGLALTLTPQPTAASLARLALAAAGAPPAPMPEPELEALRCAIPTARALPLLALLARGTPGAVVLEYLQGFDLAVACAPCA